MESGLEPWPTVAAAPSVMKDGFLGLSARGVAESTPACVSLTCPFLCRQPSALH